MPTSLSKGGNVSLTKEDSSISRVLVGLGWEAGAGGGAEFDLDASAFLVTTEGRVRGDADFIFYNQPVSSDGSVRHLGDHRTGSGSGDDERIQVTLAQVPPAIDRVVFAVTIHGAESRRQNFGHVRNAFIRVANDETGRELARYDLSAEASTETAMVFGELYRRGSEWKFRAVGQGFTGGLDPLARSFGVDIDGQPTSAPVNAPPPVPSPPVVNPEPARPAQPPRQPATPAVNLSKVTLQKRGDSISLAKQPAGFGQIVVNLNWSRQTGGGLFSKSKGIDLDLCSLFELADGRRGGVQALGNNFGSLNEPPFIKLDADDRTGDATSGEFLRLNGAHWSEIRRVLVYAFIYEGVPNWAAADGVITVTVPNEPVLEVRLDSQGNNQGTCAVAMVENVNGGIKVTKLIEYFRSASDMDRAHKFGLRWTRGSKD